eukprot:1551900-Alexandrium_andersonii.AAC.1
MEDPYAAQTYRTIHPVQPRTTGLCWHRDPPRCRRAHGQPGRPWRCSRKTETQGIRRRGS